jgi:hypothetical protein
MPSPSNADYLYLLNSIHVSGGTATVAGVPPGWSVLQQPTSDSTTGLVAAAFFNNTTYQVVTVFNGVSTPSGPNAGATTADEILADGTLPTAYNNAVLGFASTVKNTAAAAGLSIATDNMFVAGNSLGGYAAQVVAQADGFGGASYGGPGMPGYGGSGGTVANFTKQTSLA